MQREQLVRGSVAALVLSAMLAACASAPKVDVRQVGVALDRPTTGDPIALGQGALAIGHVGLALEQFRAALRSNPASLDALTGIAHCYDEMGRADLARRYYEQALALAPANIPLLRQYAGSLARHGAATEAQAVISEIALRTRAPATQWVIEPASAAPRKDGGEEAIRPAAVDTPQGAKKVRLERLSLGEVALVTSGSPVWIALPMARPGPAVRLLNAARREGLAARNRDQLAGVGWRRIEIGDADRVRVSSLILYPDGRAREARSLGHSLRISALRREDRADIVVMLGRDRA